MKTFRITSRRQFLNRVFQTLLHLGLAPPGMVLLTTRGRKTGRPHSIPVWLVRAGGERWLVSPYGEVDWVRNARAAGQVTLARGRRSETVRVVELRPAASAPVLKQYVSRTPVVRPYFDACPDSPVEAFAAEAARHPVFRVEKERTS